MLPNILILPRALIRPRTILRRQKRRHHTRVTLRIRRNFTQIRRKYPLRSIIIDHDRAFVFFFCGDGVERPAERVVEDLDVYWFLGWGLDGFGFVVCLQLQISHRTLLINTILESILTIQRFPRSRPLRWDKRLYCIFLVEILMGHEVEVFFGVLAFVLDYWCHLLRGWFA